MVKLPRIGLFQEGVELFDEVRDGGLFVHGLVGQWTELGAQCGYHPAGKVEVATLGGAEMLFDRDKLLLSNKAMPAAE